MKTVMLRCTELWSFQVPDDLPEDEETLRAYFDRPDMGWNAARCEGIEDTIYFVPNRKNETGANPPA